VGTTRKQKQALEELDRAPGSLELKQSSLQFGKTDIWTRLLLPPNIRIEPDYISESESLELVIVWQDGRFDDYEPSPRVEGLLREFYCLAGEADEPDEKFGDAVLKFAKRWGVFGTWPRKWIVECKYESHLCEPLSIWRQFARTTRAIIQVGKKLRNGILTSKSEWTDIWPDGWRADIGKQRGALSKVLSTWLNRMHTYFSFTWIGADKPMPQVIVNLNCIPTGWDDQTLTASTKERWDVAELVLNPVLFAGHPMRSSPLFNALCFQLVATLVSDFDFCQRPECHAPFKKEHGHETLCSDDCRRKQRSENAMTSRKKRLQAANG